VDAVVGEDGVGEAQTGETGVPRAGDLAKGAKEGDSDYLSSRGDQLEGLMKQLVNGVYSTLNTVMSILIPTRLMTTKRSGAPAVESRTSW